MPTIIECVNAGNTGGSGSWEDKPYTFNDYPRALLTLFEMSTTEGWMDVMAASVDRVETGGGSLLRCASALPSLPLTPSPASQE